MKPIKLLLAVTVLIFVATSAQAASLSLKLHGLIPAMGGSVWDHGYGANGLYLGDDWGNINHKYTNFTWEEMDMTIAKNGDASISGKMIRGDGAIWGLDIQLKDVQYVGGLEGASGIYDDILWDIKNADNAGTGLEWKTLSMELTAPYETAVPQDDWVGLAMPKMGHPNSAELHSGPDGEIYFDAWYQNDQRCEWREYCYNVGDTKTKAWISKPVPEPTAALVFGGGMLIASSAVRRRRA